jgi:hypothetical protein
MVNCEPETNYSGENMLRLLGQFNAPLSKELTSGKQG